MNAHSGHSSGLNKRAPSYGDSIEESCNEVGRSYITVTRTLGVSYSRTLVVPHRCAFHREDYAQSEATSLSSRKQSAKRSARRRPLARWVSASRLPPDIFEARTSPEEWTFFAQANAMHETRLPSAPNQAEEISPGVWTGGGKCIRLFQDMNRPSSTGDPPTPSAEQRCPRETNYINRCSLSRLQTNKDARFEK